MAISAKFEADFSSFYNAVQKAEVKLVDFSKGAGNVERSLNRMVDNFSGRKVIQESALMEKALSQIGGVSKLTQAELQALASKAAEATAKMKALGLEVPPGIAKIAKEAKALNKSQDDLLGKLGNVAGAFGLAFGVSTITSAIAKVGELGSRLSDLESKTGIGTTALQEFQYAGQQVGVSLETVTSAIGQFENRLGSGDKSALGALTALGISFQDIRSLKPEDQFKLIAEKLATVTDQTAFVKVGMDLMGKGFLEVAPLIRADLEALIEQARRLGVILDQETVQNLDKLDDSLTNLHAVGQAVLADVLTPFVPLLTTVGDGFSGLGHWVKDSQIAFEQFLSIGSGWIQWFADAQVSVLELTNVFGANSAKIGMLKETSARYAEIAKQLSTTQTEVTKATTATAKAVTTLDTSYDQVDTSATKAAESQKKLAASFRDFYNFVEERRIEDERNLKAHLEREAAAMRAFNNEIGVRMMEDWRPEVLGSRTPDLPLTTMIKAAKVELAGAHDELARWEKDLSSLAGGLTQLAQVSGDSFSGIVQDIGRVVAAMDLAAKSGKDFKAALGSGSRSGMAVSGIGAVTAVGAATNAQGKGSTAKNVVGGAAAGAQIGMVAGPYGALVGAGVGAIVGLARSIGRVTQEEKDARKAAAELGDELARLLTPAQQLAIGGESWKMTVVAVKEEFAKAGLSASDAEAAVGRLWDATREGPDAAKAAREAIESVIQHNGDIARAIFGAGFQSSADLEGLAVTAKEVYETMLRSGKYTAEQLAKAFEDSAAAQRRAVGDPTQLSFDAAHAAGYKTREELEDLAAEARKTYDDMRASGLYTAEVLGEAWQDSLDKQSKALGTASGSIQDLLGEYKRMSDSVADEAPEKVMGVIEKRTRAEMKVLKQTSEDQLKQMGFDAESAAKEFERVLESLDPKTIKIPYEFVGPPLPGGSREAPEPGDRVPGFASGTHGKYLNFGSGTMVKLHGRERVMREGEEAGGGSGTTVHVHVAGNVVTERELAKALSQHMDREFQARHKVRAA